MTAIDAPLFTDTVIGVRAWDVSSTTQWELLEGYEETAWATDGEFTEAVCMAGIPDDEAHEQKAPWGDCSCGLYAAHPFREAALHHHLNYVFQEKLGASGFPGCHHHPRAMRVYGVIEATGHMEVHRHGFRAEFARPIGLLLPGADPHRYHVLDLCRRYRAHRIDSLLGETLESFVNKRTTGGLTEDSVDALLEPVLKTEEEAELAEARAEEERWMAARPLSARFKESIPRPIYWPGWFLYFLGCAIVGVGLWLFILLIWLLPVFEIWKALMK